MSSDNATVIAILIFSTISAVVGSAVAVGFGLHLEWPILGVAAAGIGGAIFGFAAGLLSAAVEMS